jgi:hypothetical protein
MQSKESFSHPFKYGDGIIPIRCLFKFQNFPTQK